MRSETLSDFIRQQIPGRSSDFPGIPLSTFIFGDSNRASDFVRQGQLLTARQRKICAGVPPPPTTTAPAAGLAWWGGLARMDPERVGPSAAPEAAKIYGA
nr:MAG TPA: hypothetical protein [Caudoviricetes sp.]